MIRVYTAVIMVALLAICPIVSTAATTFTPGAAPTIQLIPPIPMPPCPPTPAYSWCDSIKSQVQTVNGVIKIENQIAGQQQVLLQEVSFPQKLVGHAQQDLDAFDNLVNETDNTINDVVPNIDAAVQGSFAKLSHMVNPVAIDKLMADHAKNAVTTMLLTTHAVDKANKRQLTGFSGLKTAAAQATTPQEALNIEIQGLSILGSELAHSQTVQRARITAEATYKIDELSKQSSTDKTREEATAKLDQAFGEPTPTPSP